jgi:hypothetical protein
MSAMEVELSALKEKVSFFNVIYGKFDVTLGKIQEMIENRRYENNEDIKEVYDRIASSEKTLLDEIKTIRTELKLQHEEHSRKIAEIDKWRWVMIGGAVVIGWFIEKISAVFTGG